MASIVTMIEGLDKEFKRAWEAVRQDLDGDIVIHSLNSFHAGPRRPHLGSAQAAGWPQGLRVPGDEHRRELVPPRRRQEQTPASQGQDELAGRGVAHHREFAFAFW